MIKVSSGPIKPFTDPIKERPYQAIQQDVTLNNAEDATIINASEATVKRRLGELKEEGIIRLWKQKDVTLGSG